MPAIRASVKVFKWSDIDDVDAFFETGGDVGYGGSMEVVGKGFITREKHYPHAVHESVISAASALSLTHAMKKIAADFYEEVRIFVAHDDDYSASRPGAAWNGDFHLAIDDDQLVAKIEISLPDASRSDPRLDLIIREFASRAGLLVSSMNTYLDVDGTSLGYGGWENSAARHETDPSPEVREQFERSVRDGKGENRDVAVVLSLPAGEDDTGLLVKGAAGLAALIRTTGGSTPTVEAVRTWVRAGRLEPLEGLRENSWLEVKSAPYLLGAPGDSGTKQKIELAQDVARFVNGGVDSVLLIGFPEVARDGVLVVGKARPVPLSMIDIQQIRGVLDDRIVPIVVGLEVEVILVTPDTGVLMISVLPQAPELYPHLVRGSLVGDKVEGAFFSIVQRRGEGSVAIDATQVHTYLVAGRAFLRNGLRKPS